MSDEDLRDLITRTAEENRRQFEETRQHFDVVSEGLRHEIRIVAEGVLRNGEKIDETRSELGQRIDRNSEKIDNNRALIQKNAEKIDGNAEKIESNAEKIEQNRILIERNATKIDQNADKIDGNAGKIEHLDGSMHKQFDETRSMIRISYSELDRRLRSLEDNVSSLQSRVDRLESTN